MISKKAYSFLFSLALLLAANGCRHAPSTAVNPPATPQATNPPAFKSPSGKTYQATSIGAADNDEPIRRVSHATGASSGDEYLGSSRMAAKLSIVPGNPQPFAALSDLLDSLPADEVMRALHIDEVPNSGRLAQEQELVVVKAFLYASSKESDNDFHCIMGVDPSLPPRYMNVEVSALPASSDPFFAALSAARNQFKAFFGNGTDALPTRGYIKYDPPIPVQITGSIFFDVDHVPPAVGPTGMKPQTAWEIHPVSDIQFEPPPT